MTMPAVTKHLNVLESASLISRRRVSRSRRCRIEPTGLETVATWVETLQATCEQNYQRLDALLEEMGESADEENE